MKDTKVASLAAEAAMTLTLHTHSAVKVWAGRKKTDKQYGVMGLPGFVAKMRIIEDAIRKDDPYALYHFSVIQDAISAIEEEYAAFEQDINSIMSSVPKALTLPDVSSSKPAVYEIKFASRTGFSALYQLIKLDELVLKVLKAQHIAKISVKDKIKLCHVLESRIRRLFNLTYKYHFTDVTRDDMAANNAKARRAIELMGDLEEEYLTGEAEVENAPLLPEKREIGLLDKNSSEAESLSLMKTMLSSVEELDDDKAKTA